MYSYTYKELFPTMRKSLLPLAPVALLGVATLTHAQSTWNGSGTDWNTASNWDGGLPGASAIAVFNTSFANQPSLSAPISVGAVWATNGLGQDVIIGGGSLLTLAKTTVNGQAGTAVYLDASANHNLTFNAPITANGGTFTNNSSGVLTIAGGFNVANTNFLNGNNAAGVIALHGYEGSGNLSINTAGTVRFFGSSSNNGTTTLSAGTMDLQGTVSFGSSVISEVGSVVTTTSASGTSVLVNTDNKAVTLHGAVRDGDNAVLAISKSQNTLTLSGSNSYSGGTTLGTSTSLVVGHDHALGTGGVTTTGNNVTIRSSSADARTIANRITLGGNTTFGSASTGNLYLEDVEISGSGKQIFVENAFTSIDKLTGSGLTMQKRGAGILEIRNDGASTFNGNISVTAGTLLINTNLSTTTGNSSNSAATVIGGNGTLGGNLTVNGILAPGGDALDTARFTVNGNLTLGGGSESVFQINGLTDGTQFDAVTVGGSLTYGGTLTLNFGFAPVVGTTFDLFDFTSRAGTSEFSAINFVNTGYAGTFDYTTGVLTVTAVPEPGAITLLAAGAAAFTVFGRRRRTR
jgi:autotransporter-associated beta strand protein